MGSMGDCSARQEPHILKNSKSNCNDNYRHLFLKGYLIQNNLHATQSSFNGIVFFQFYKKIHFKDETKVVSANARLVTFPTPRRVAASLAIMKLTASYMS